MKWIRLPPALTPGSEPWSRDGIFSGSAGVSIKPGEAPYPYLIFTGELIETIIVLSLTVYCVPPDLGVTNFSELGFYFQQQGLATPLNLSDPLLTSWSLMKSPVQMELPPGGK